LTVGLLRRSLKSKGKTLMKIKNGMAMVLCAAVGLSSVNGFASQARNLISGGGDAGLILGTGGFYGSFYSNDDYNIFWNPALIRNSRNWAVIEHDDTAFGGDQSAGVVSAVGNYHLGVFLNRPTGTTHGAAQPVDLVFGGDSGFKWGVNYTRSLSTGPAIYSSLKAGIVVRDLEPFVHLTLDDTNGAAAETKTTNTVVGTRYHYGDWTPYVAYRTRRETIAGVQAGSSTQTYGLGLGKTFMLGDLRLEGALSYWHSATGTAKTAVMPLNLHAAADATGWLTFRGGFRHDLIVRSLTALTTSFVGATVKVGKAEFDTVVGSVNNGLGFSDNEFVNLGMTYRF